MSPISMNWCLPVTSGIDTFGGGNEPFRRPATSLFSPPSFAAFGNLKTPFRVSAIMFSISDIFSLILVAFLAVLFYSEVN